MCCCGDMKDVVGIGDCVERKDRMNSIHLAKSRHFIQGVWSGSQQSSQAKKACVLPISRQHIRTSWKATHHHESKCTYVLRPNHSHATPTLMSVIPRACTRNYRFSNMLSPNIEEMDRTCPRRPDAQARWLPRVWPQSGRGVDGDWSSHGAVGRRGRRVAGGGEFLSPEFRARRFTLPERVSRLCLLLYVRVLPFLIHQHRVMLNCLRINCSES